MTTPFFDAQEDIVYVSSLVEPCTKLYFFSPIQVNANGVISFRNSFDDFIPNPFPLTSVDILIAPFWDDHDVRIEGRILYRFSEEASLLEEVGASVNASFGLSFTPTLLFIATWEGVAQFVVNVCMYVRMYESIDNNYGETCMPIRPLYSSHVPFYKYTS